MEVPVFMVRIILEKNSYVENIFHIRTWSIPLSSMKIAKSNNILKIVAFLNISKKEIQENCHSNFKLLIQKF